METTPILSKTRSTELDRVRAQFPALSREHEGLPVAYFDGPGGTQVPARVADAMRDYLLQHNANTHWSYPSSRETDGMIAGAREALADFLGATPEEVAFGANMTTLTFHLARALGHGFLPADEIVLTELDHHANVAPWRALEKERGVRTRMARMNPETGQLDWEHFESLLGAKTRLVAIGAASNALGTVTDVARAAKAAHAVGAQIFVDAVHFAPHQLVDARAFDCDFLACSAYKFYGPHIGILFGRRELLGEVDFPKLEPAPNEPPERAETGTQNHEGIAGAAAAVDFLASLGQGRDRRARLASSFATQHARGQDLVRKLWFGLGEIPEVKLFGPTPEMPRTPTIAFTVAGVSARQVAEQLAARGLFLSDGDFYASTVVQRLGLIPHGLVRAGCACYTSEEEIDRLIDAVREVARE